MSIIRAEKAKNYSVICNGLLRRSDISAKAKGVWCYFMTLPEDWDVYLSEIQKHFTDGRDSLRSAMKELEEKGYLIKNKTRNSEGKYDGWEYIIYETPKSGKPKSEIPTSENRTLLSTNKKPSTNNTNISEQGSQESNETENTTTLPTTLTTKSDIAKWKKHINTRGNIHYPEPFEKLWSIYPRKTDKRAGCKKWLETLYSGAVSEDIEKAVRNYAEEAKDSEERYIKHMKTFFGLTEPWREFVEIEKKSVDNPGITLDNGFIDINN